MRARYFGIAILVTAVFAASALSQAPRGKMVNIGSSKLFMNCTGSGKPTVILEAGAGAWSIHWANVQAELAKSNRVCSYDRAGLGKSDAGEMPRTAKQAAADLEQLLSKSKETGPYILAGHSFGGWVIRLFQESNPDKVMAMAMIDSAHHAQWERLPAAEQMLKLGIGAFKKQFGALNSGEVGVEAFPSRLPPPLLREFHSALKLKKMQNAVLSEMENSVLSAKQAGNTKKLGGLPLMVLTAGNSFAAFLPDNEKNKPMLEGLNKGWMEMQVELAALSTNSKHLISRRALHTINQDSPKLVAYSIRLAAEMAKRAKKESREVKTK